MTGKYIPIRCLDKDIFTMTPHLISVAPMMDYTDRHDRYFLRLLSRYTVMYTEMITAPAILRGDREKLLKYDPAEHPVVVQLGGSDPAELAAAARICAAAGYDEINLNVGCPSDRVQSGRFGACLMAEGALVGECIAAMQAEVDVPVTVKIRIGIDEQDSYAFLCEFVQTVKQAGCDTFIVHARKAWLQGLSPKENREIPPLQYDRVYQLKQDFPELQIHINGGITSLDEAAAHMQHVDGVMIGRAAYHHPYILAEVDQRFHGVDEPVISRAEVVQRFLPYIENELAQGTRLNNISRHILGLFSGQKGARQWRRYISENAHKPGAGTEVIEEALRRVEEA